MLIAEINITSPLTKVLTIHSPFVYKSTIGAHTTASYWTSTFGAAGDTTAISTTVTGFVENPATFYTSVNSISQCEALERSFYWDDANQTIYVHITHTTMPDYTKFSLGIAAGFSDRTVLYLDDTEYLPLLQSVPSIAQKADPIAYSQLAFISGAVTFDNKDGTFDRFIDEPLYGNELKIYYVEPDYTRHSQAIPLASFYIEDYSFSLQKFSVKVQDKRKAGKQNILTEKTVLDADVPLVYGQCRVIKALPNVAEGSTGTVTYRAAVTLTSLGTVQTYSDSTKKWVDKTPTATDLANGSFTLSQADGRTGGTSDGTPVQCRLLEPTGITATTAPAVIADLNARAGIPFTSVFYDTVEWAAESSTIGAIAIAFTKQIELIEAIKQVQAGADKRFRYEINAEGLRTIRLDNWSRPNTYLTYLTTENGTEITQENGEQLLILTTRPRLGPMDIKDSRDLTVDTDSKLYYSSVVAKYDKNFDEGTSLTTTNTTYETTAFNLYRQKRTFELETLLPTLAQAQAIAETYASRLSTIRGILTCDLHGKDYYQLRIYDMLEIDLGTSNRTYFGTWKAQVLAINPKFDALVNQVTLLLTERI